MERYWFADVDNDETSSKWQWQPCFQDGPGLVVDIDIWFATKEECEAWIRDSLGVEPR